MSSVKKIKRLFAKSDVTVNSKVDDRIINDALTAFDKSEKTKPVSAEHNIWRIIMKNRITKLAASAVIIIAILFGLKLIGGPDMTNVAWAELVQRVEQSHDEYMKKLLLAAEEKDSEKIEFYADLFSDFWQRLGWLAGAELDQEFRIRMSAIMAEEKARCDEREASDQIGFRIFLIYSDQFRDWLGKIEDVTWINETVHVCKQMEEYAEEIRDAARYSELGFPYIEHCLPSFVAYCEWFKQLPWDDPGEHVGADRLLTAIERDLQIARREIESLEIFDADRYARRCMDQARKNVLQFDKKMARGEMGKQWKLCRQLTQRIDELCDLISYAQIARWQFLQTAKAYSRSETYQAGIAKWRGGQIATTSKETCHHILTKEFGNKASFADYFVERIDQSLDLCKELSQNFESKQ